MQKITLLILTLCLILSCGVKGPPLTPPDGKLPSLIKEYQDEVSGISEIKKSPPSAKKKQ